MSADDHAQIGMADLHREQVEQGKRTAELTTEVRVGLTSIQGTLAMLVRADAERRETLLDHELRLREKAEKADVEQLREDVRDELSTRERRTYAVLGTVAALLVAALAFLQALGL